MRRDVQVLVIGAGPSGVATGYHLLRSGITDFVILEKGDDIGGCWRENTYPGCGCDVPSIWYSFSFNPNPGWSRRYCRQPEIQRYLRATADKYGITGHTRFSVTVGESRWDPVTGRWQIQTDQGPYTAEVLVAASGPLHQPRLPDVPGLATFTGPKFHSARWDHSVDLTGKRVAVVGSGASAVQFVPEISGRTGELHVFQRTAPWVLPKSDGPVPAWQRAAFRLVPQLQALRRFLIYLQFEAFGIAFRRAWLMRRLQKVALRNLRRQVTDPGLRARLTPDFVLGCKAPVPSNDWYPAITAPNARVHGGLTGIRRNSVLSADGAETEVDVLIFGTGFEVAESPIAKHVFDEDGVSLAERWGDAPQAYLGTTVAGFPNLFLFLGPNIIPGHASVLGTIERQAQYVAAAAGAMIRGRWARLDVRRDVQDEWNAGVQRALRPTVYNSGCAGFYLHPTGRNIVNYPRTLARLHRELHFRPGDFTVTLRKSGRESTLMPGGN
ncbi:NAD(P)/FAD-dependent oxidoreductase [Pseudonocardiaceae bacterium YIM PH 21723]|nr:NAD(P)/FAD-dependent oxidoreductase [Pseudonocardiaceae bacterium YIM PH 21723]